MLNDLGVRTQRGTVRNHFAAVGAVVVEAVGFAQFVDLNILRWIEVGVDNYTARAAAVGLSQPLAESTGMVWVRHRRKLVQDPRK
jgi:hypothetical protein